MITYLQVKQVLRNKRFILFTLFIPVCWYFILYNIQNILSSNQILSIAVFIGIIGNCLATFSKRISSEKNFYIFYSKLSNYTMKRFLLNQVLVQFILNTCIFLLVFITGAIFSDLQISSIFLIQFMLLSIMGIYLSFFGFLIGSRVSSIIIDTISFPLIIVAALTIIPFNQFDSINSFLRISSMLQKAFPGYYYNELMTSLLNNSHFDNVCFLWFLIIVIIHIVFVFLLIPKDQFKRTM